MPLFNAIKASFMRGDVDLEGDTIRLCLLADTWTPSIDSNDFWNDISANEISGTGYSAGGATLANKSVTADNTDDEGVFDADDVTWTTATFTARYAVLVLWTGVSSTSNLIGYWDFGANRSPSGVDFTIQFNAEGIINLT